MRVIMRLAGWLASICICMPLPPPLEEPEPPLFSLATSIASRWFWASSCEKFSKLGLFDGPRDTICRYGSFMSVT